MPDTHNPLIPHVLLDRLEKDLVGPTRDFEIDVRTRLEGDRIKVTASLSWNLQMGPRGDQEFKACRIVHLDPQASSKDVAELADGMSAEVRFELRTRIVEYRRDLLKAAAEMLTERADSLVVEWYETA